MAPNTLRAVLACAAAVVVTTGACSRDAGSAEGTGPPSLVRDGTLTVCSDIPYKPFEYPDEAEPERFQGYDVDTIEAIAAANGWETDWVVTPSDGIFAALDAGDCDVIASAVAITDEHREQADLTEPYFESAVAMVVRRADADVITGLTAVAGKRLGVQSGGAAERYVGEHAPGVTVVAFPGDTELFAALEAGDVDAILQDLPLSEQHTSDDTSIAMVATYPTGESLGFAVEKNANPALLATLNEGIARLDADGERERIFRKYFPDAP